MFKPKRLIYMAAPKINTADLKTNKDFEEAAANINAINSPQAANIDQEKEVKGDIDAKVDAKRKELDALAKRGLTANQRWLDQESALRYKADLDRATSPEVKLQILQNLDARRHRFKQWQERLPLGNNVILDDGTRLATVFTLDPTRGFDSRTHYTEKFIGLSEQEQETWLRLILDNINERKTQFNKLVGMVSKDFKDKELKLFQAKTREERDSYLGLFEQHTQLIDRGKYHPKMKERLKAVFAEQGLNGKRLEIARLREAISVSSLDDKFRDAPKSLQNMTEEEFVLLSGREKNQELMKMRNTMRREYQSKYRGKPHFTDQDIQDFDSFANSNAWSFEQGGWSFSQMQECIKQFHEAEDTAIECYEKGQEYSDEILKHHNWDRIGSWERKAIIDSGKLDKEEHLKWDKAYKEKIEGYMPGKKHGKYGLISKKSAKLYLEWFEKQEIKDKQKYLKKDDLENTKKERIKNNKRFEGLAPQYIKEYEKKYITADSEDRADIITEIETKDKLLTKKFGDKVDKMLKAKTLAAKSGPQYIEWFADLNISEKEKHLKASDLDDKNRSRILNSFKEDVLPNVPASKLKQIEKKFYASDLDERIKLLTKYLKEYGDGKTIEDVIPPEEAKSAENLTLDFLLKKAEQFAAEGKTSTAIDLYQDWLEKVKEFPELATKAEINEVKAEIQRLKDEDIELSSEGEIPEVLQKFIEHECERLIMDNDALKQEVKNLTVIEEFSNIMARNELRFGKKTGVEQQMSDTIQNDEIKDLDQLIKDQSEGTEAIMQEGSQYKVAKTNVIDLKDFRNDETYREDMTELVAEEIIQKPEHERTNQTFGAKIDGREVNAEEFKRREVEPIKQNVDETIIENILQSLAARGFDSEVFRNAVASTVAARRHKVDIKPKRNKKRAA